MSLPELTPEQHAAFAMGQRVRIPAGVHVKSLHPSIPSGQTTRARWVTSAGLDDGVSVSVSMHAGEESGRERLRLNYPHIDMEEAFGAYDALDAERRAATSSDERLRLFRAMQEVHITVMPPRLHWAGTGGYWCSCSALELLP